MSKTNRRSYEEHECFLRKHPAADLVSIPDFFVFVNAQLRLAEFISQAVTVVSSGENESFRL